jgi:ribosomal protein S18 acetylase RimI-like enzyme
MPDTVITIRPFTPTDAPQMRRLVLNGLGDHFGTIDETMNPDLDDITATYHDADAAIVIAERDGEIVGCGILIPEDEAAGRLVRMSVRGDQRGQGLGKRLVRELLAAARERGYTAVVCETTEDWTDAIALYRSCGFTEIGRWGGDTHFTIDLSAHE